MLHATGATHMCPYGNTRVRHKNLATTVTNSFESTLTESEREGEEGSNC